MVGCEGYRAGLAGVYDRFNAEVDYRRWADFIEKCFDRFLPSKPGLVLDLACGTGRMTHELARRGYDMIGVDGSADMLSEAYNRTVEGRSVLFLQQDMRSFELYGTVGAVTCCLDSLNYLLTPEDLEKCFASVNRYLDPNGLFLFDMNTPFKFRNIYGNRDYVLEDQTTDGSRILCAWQNDYDKTTKLCDFYLSLFEESPDGRYCRSEEHQTERCYTMDEIRSALEHAGLELLGVYADFNFKVPTGRTPRWYFAARAIKMQN